MLILKLLLIAGFAWILIGITACGSTENLDSTVALTAAQQSQTTHDHGDEQTQTPEQRLAGIQLKMPGDIVTANPGLNSKRQAYFGDLHVHTTYSFDAFAFGTLATPYDAYRYARGEAIKHPAGFEVKLRTPLDFYAVTDHAMFLGVVGAAADRSTDMSKLAYVESLHNLNAPENLNLASMPQRVGAFTNFLPQTLIGLVDGAIDMEMVNGITRDAWTDTIKAAEQFNKPGEFTTFVAYEYTSSTDDRGNLHRNVIFRGADKLPVIPFSRFHSQNPEGLWDWMDGLRDQGVESLAIPHNSNGSNGHMFKLVDWVGNPIDDAYAEQRLRNEPLIELSQIKGTSETHPLLSATDEWADFEIMPYRIATMLPSEPHGSYAREALLNGLAFEDKGIANPYKFGFIGASDTHTGATSDDESNYFSKVGLLDSNGALRGAVPLSEEQVDMVRQAARTTIKEIDGNAYMQGAYETWGASGLTGVWAEENSRDAIYNAFRRKETFVTSGPRIRVRLFGGFGFDQMLLDAPDMLTQAYGKGVSMGSDLLAKGSAAPSFMAWAMRDANSAALQRLQIIKGWTVNGEHHEMVYDVACSDGGAVDPVTHRCPDNGATVDLSNCSITPNLGDAELRTVWTDPDYTPGVRAFYYARVLENPTCRWSTWDAIRAKVPPRSDMKSTIQERAWSSPIWLLPNS